MTSIRGCLGILPLLETCADKLAGGTLERRTRAVSVYCSADSGDLVVDPRLRLNSRGEQAVADLCLSIHGL
jgi:hypothetical protein